MTDLKKKNPLIYRFFNSFEKHFDNNKYSA